MKKYKAALVLMVLVLVAGLGAKMYSTITMGDGEWIGLAADAGRIVFDDQATDEIEILDANVGFGITAPAYKVQVSENIDNFALVVTNVHANAHGLYIDSDGSAATEYPLFVRTDTMPYILVATGTGKVGVGDSTPFYDLDVAGNIRATEDAIAEGTVFIGEEEDADEDGDHMLLRADSADGGYALWSYSDFTGAVIIFDGDGVVGPETVLHARWLTHSDTTGDFTSGETFLINGPHAQDDVVIAADEDHEELCLHFYEEEVLLQTVGSAGHYYDVTLTLTWVED